MTAPAIHALDGDPVSVVAAAGGGVPVGGERSAPWAGSTPGCASGSEVCGLVGEDLEEEDLEEGPTVMVVPSAVRVWVTAGPPVGTISR